MIRALNAFERQLIRHEGLSTKAYYDSEGVLTIGVGHNLEATGISETLAIALMREDVARHVRELEQAFPVARRLDTPRRQVLMNMAFNLGIPRLQGFRRMWAAIDRQDWPTAAAEMLDSRWAQQVGRRAEELARQMLTGETPPEGSHA